jgi:predicted SnoaL-like aldol condensation-catalyzing enzyme
MGSRLLFILLAGIFFLSGCSASVDGQAARNIEVVHAAAAEVFSQGRLERIDGLYAADFIGHFPEGIVRGRETLKELVTAHRRAFPDWTEEIDDTIAQGNRVAIRFTSRGTNKGKFLANRQQVIGWRYLRL